MSIKNFIKLVIIASLLTLTIGCQGETADGKDSSKGESADKGAVVAEGTYKTDVKSRVSFYDNKKMEKVYSELILKGDQVTYKAYRDGKLLNTKTGTYDKARRVFMLKKEGAPKEDKHGLKDITPTGFKMKNGRFGLEFKKQ